MNKLSRTALLAMLLAWLPAGMLSTAVQAEEQSAAEFSERGLKGCLKCHGEDAKTPVLSVLRGPHATMADPNSPFADGNHTCEGCHGASRSHTEKYEDDADRPAPGVNFGKPGTGKYSSAQAQNEACLGCHQSQGHAVEWQGSAHDMADVTCSDCHLSHAQGGQDPVLKRQTQFDVCGQCHTNERLDGRKTSHHPMEEGLTICTDCHNPHGSSGEASLIKATVNDTCYTCHAEKRGPFLWEHEPVQENCTNCHFAHGSNNQRLLKTRPPFLCAQCHSAGHSDGRLDGSDVVSSNKLNQKACLNCHAQVHGSNHPSGVRRHR